MLCKNGNSFRGRINAGLLGDRETLEAKESLSTEGLLWGKAGAY